MNPNVSLFLGEMCKSIKKARFNIMAMLGLDVKQNNEGERSKYELRGWW